MRIYLLLISFTLLFTACNDTKSYHILYPIQASKQEVLRLDGFRFLASDQKSPIAIMILSNPVENGSFVEAIFAYTNHTKNVMHIKASDIVVKMRKKGVLSVLTKKEYEASAVYKKVEAISDLTPKMKAYGCAPDASENNTAVATMTPEQKLVWQKHLAYPFKDEALYLETLVIQPGESKVALIRFNLPQTDTTFKQAIILMKFTLEDKKRHHFKFVLQSLD